MFKQPLLVKSSHVKSKHLPWCQRWRWRHTGAWRWYWGHFIFEVWKCFNDQITKFQQCTDFILQFLCEEMKWRRNEIWVNYNKVYKIKLCLFVICLSANVFIRFHIHCNWNKSLSGISMSVRHITFLLFVQNCRKLILRKTILVISKMISININLISTINPSHEITSIIWYWHWHWHSVYELFMCA